MIDAYEDLINSRDVIDRLAELEDTDIYPIGELTHDQIAEITTLRVLAAQGENLGGWEVGLTLIRDSYFEDYAREYADDSCAGSYNPSWPYNHIDWAEAANELQQDYTSIEFDNVTYWARA